MTISELLLEDDRARPRSLQTEIGMSEVGGCRRRAGYRLNRIEPTDEGGSMPAILGTLLHEGIESRVRKKHPTALLEVEVEFAGIVGHVDMYLDGVVTDFKTTSSRFLETIKRDGPPRSHVWQVNGYAAGLTKLKWEVRRVRLVYIARDTGEEWTWDATFHPKPIADALEWVANVRDTPLEMLPRDYQPDSPFCQSCPFRTLCWDGGVTGRDPLSVLYVDDPDAAKWAEELHAARLDKKDAEEREERAKGALDALRPNDTGTATVDVGYRLPLVWQVRKGRRTVDVDELERQGVEVPYKTGSPSVVLAFGAPLEASSD